MVRCIEVLDNISMAEDMSLHCCEAHGKDYIQEIMVFPDNEKINRSRACSRHYDGHRVAQHVWTLMKRR